jgi:hypothetical protein
MADCVSQAVTADGMVDTLVLVHRELRAEFKKAVRLAARIIKLQSNLDA